MVRCFFLMSHFLVVESFELSKSTIHRLSVLLILECLKILSRTISFFSTLIVSLMMLLVRLLSKLMILLSTHHVTKHMTCRNMLRFDLKYQNCWKIFTFFISWFSILKCQELVIKVVYSSTNI